MSDAPQPTSGNLSAKIIRACPTHRSCPLSCKFRKVEDLGEVASFATTSAEPKSDLLSRVKHLFQKE